MTNPHTNRIAIFLIKFVHTLIFFVLSAGILYTVYSGLVNRVTRWTHLAMASIVVEGVVLLLYGGSCPLRLWAERLGDAKGSVTDIFLPRWLADRIFTLCTPLFLLGSALVLVRGLANGRARARCMRRAWRRPGGSHRLDARPHTSPTKKSPADNFASAGDSACIGARRGI